MSGHRVEDSTAILRYVPPRLIKEDGTVDGAAFLPRPTDCDGSSVHRSLYYSDKFDESFAEIKRRFRLNVAKSGKFAEAFAGDLRSCANEIKEIDLIDVVKDPLLEDGNFEEDPAHALIVGLPTRGLMDELIVLLIEKVIVPPLHSTSQA